MATTYLSPGVYVEEVPPVARPIAGVSTSTAGFIGIVPDRLSIPGVIVTNENIGTGNGTKTTFGLGKYPVQTDVGTFKMRVNGIGVKATLSNDDVNRISNATFDSAPANNASLTGDYTLVFQVTDESLTGADGTK